MEKTLYTDLTLKGKYKKLKRIKSIFLFKTSVLNNRLTDY